MGNGSGGLRIAPRGQAEVDHLNPTTDARQVNDDTPLCQEITHILKGQRVAQIPPHRTKNDIAREQVMLERGFARHVQPQKRESGQTN